MIVMGWVKGVGCGGGGGMGTWEKAVLLAEW